MQRNYASIWQKYTQYNDSNTLMISPHYNLIEDYQRNDLILPLYDPLQGQSDFLDDKHLAWGMKYLSVLAGLETTIGEDMRK